MSDLTTGMCKGDRVRLSQEGQALHPYLPQRDRLGTVRGYSRDGACVWVLWDGLKTSTAYHHDFLDVITE